MLVVLGAELALVLVAVAALASVAVAAVPAVPVADVAVAGGSLSTAVAEGSVSAGSPVLQATAPRSPAATGEK
jgi:hypothetical protein